jgi:hypothetical protein
MSSTGEGMTSVAYGHNDNMTVISEKSVPKRTRKKRTKTNNTLPTIIPPVIENTTPLPPSAPKKTGIVKKRRIVKRRRQPLQQDQETAQVTVPPVDGDSDNSIRTKPRLVRHQSTDDNTFDELLQSGEFQCEQEDPGVITDDVIVTLQEQLRPDGKNPPHREKRMPGTSSSPMSPLLSSGGDRMDNHQHIHENGKKSATNFLPLQELYKMNSSAGGAALAKRAASASFYAIGALLVNNYLHYAYNCPFPKCFGHEVRHFS